MPDAGSKEYAQVILDKINKSLGKIRKEITAETSKDWCEQNVASVISVRCTGKEGEKGSLKEVIGARNLLLDMAMAVMEQASGNKGDNPDDHAIFLMGLATSFVKEAASAIKKSSSLIGDIPASLPKEVLQQAIFTSLIRLMCKNLGLNTALASEVDGRIKREEGSRMEGGKKEEETDSRSDF